MPPLQRSQSATGSSVVPKSDYLRQVLLERKSQESRLSNDVGISSPSSATSRDRRAAEVDEGASDAHNREPKTRSNIRSAHATPQKSRPQQRRSASMQGSTVSSGHLDPGSQVAAFAESRAMGSRELDKHADKLSKENFDLKLRIYLIEEHRAKEEAANDFLRSQVSELEDEQQELRTQNVELEQEALRAAAAEEAAQAELESWKNECESARSSYDHNREEIERMKRENRRLAVELERRDHAVREAAGLIHNLEAQVEALQTNLATAVAGRSKKSALDSGYYSTDTETGDVATASLSSAASSSSRPSTAPRQQPDQYHSPMSQRDVSTHLRAVSDALSGSSGSVNPSSTNHRTLSRRKKYPDDGGSISASNVQGSDLGQGTRPRPSTRDGQGMADVGQQWRTPPATSDTPRRPVSKTPTAVQGGVSGSRGELMRRTSGYSERTPSGALRNARTSRDDAKALRNLYFEGELTASAPMTPHIGPGSSIGAQDVQLPRSRGQSERSHPSANSLRDNALDRGRSIGGGMERRSGDVFEDEPTSPTETTSLSVTASSSLPQPTVISSDPTETESYALPVSPPGRWDPASMRWPPTALGGARGLPPRDVMFSRDEVDDFFFPKRHRG